MICPTSADLPIKLDHRHAAPHDRNTITEDIADHDLFLGEQTVIANFGHDDRRSLWRHPPQFAGIWPVSVAP